MDQELEQLTNQMNTEIKNIREKYKILKQECRKRHKPPKTKNSSTRKTIPKTLKNQVWDTCIGQEKGVGNCYCCSKEIDSKNFECGHILAVCKGGENKLDNLKPICSICNKSMGKQNLNEFKSQYMIDNSNLSCNNLYQNQHFNFNNPIHNEGFKYGLNFNRNTENKNIFGMIYNNHNESPWI